MRWEPFIILNVLCYVYGELITATIVGGIALAGYFSYCKFKECCTDDYIPFDISALKYDIHENVYGQPLVDEIIHILHAHKMNVMYGHSSKALTISLHGWPGNGKNFVTNLIAKHLYKEGTKSKYFKLFEGGKLINPHRVHEYQELIQWQVEAVVRSCQRSLIVFDEVQSIVPKVLDILKPMLDYHHGVNGIDYRNAIFIFISNLGGGEITNQLSTTHKPRETIVLSDFEDVIKKAAFLNPGGLQDSGTISSHLIDHFIPFLPMEESHVLQCVEREFDIQGYKNPTDQMIKDVMAILTYGPPNNPIYANAGCKRIKKQVSYILQRNRYS